MRKLTKSTIQRDKKQKTTDQENESLCNQNNTQESLLQPNRLFDNAQSSLEPAVGAPAFCPTCLNLIWPAVKHCTVNLWFVLQKHLLICLGMQFEVPKIKKMPNIYEIENDKVVGFENEAATIIKKLIRGSKEKEVVLITGMGGLGKTTLAKRVYEEKSVVDHFDKHVWCTISQEYNCEDLLNKIYNQVCGKETKKDSIAEKLRKSLMGWRYLIVLDDIWSLKAWEELNRAFPSCDNGSRVVLTSRQESVVSDAKHICLPFFTVDESWELLQVKLFKGKECPKELENIGKQISKKCGGLPLIVGLVAGLLGGVEKSEQKWQKVLNTLSSQVAFRGGMLSNNVIELSYKHLSHNLKRCLLYFSAFQEDVEIEVSYLIELWISEGFIEIKEEERVEDMAKHYLNHLVESNLVMVSKRNYDGGTLCCALHDLVHEFCLAKAKEENFLHIIKMEDKLDPTLKFTPHRISFHRYSHYGKIPNEFVPWNSSIGTILGYPKIYTSISSDAYNGSWVAKKFEYLTILNFEFIMVDKSILSEMNSLIHLKYLALYLCGCGSVSPLSLKNLQCLITLKLTSEKDLHLPKYFWNMKSLRHMTICHYDCDSCPTEPTPAGGIETISGLEVLQSLDLETFLCIRRDKHLLRKLSHLKYLNCAVSPYPFADEIDMLHHLEFLRLHELRYSLGELHSRMNPHLLKDLKLSKFPPNIKEINLESITLSSSAMSIIAQLSNLEALILVGCKFEEGEWNVEEETLFCKLKYLELINPGIRIWRISSAESFPCLEQVILNSWKLLAVPYSLADIVTLKLLCVSRCNRICERSVKKIEQDVQEMGNEQLKIILRTTGDSDISFANMTGPIKRRHDRHMFQQRGFNSTLRQGNITHHEYIQVGKGRDVGLNQIALFEGKVAGGNGEQVLSRDVYRLGQLFDFFRMLSFFFTTVGYYVCTMMTVLTVYIFLYGRTYLAFSGLDEGISRRARFLGNTALDAVLNAQFFVQIGIFTAVPMIMGFILEKGLLKAVFSFITMQMQLCSIFFTFSLGTRTHYFGRTILHGGAKYRATRRGFVVRHIKFAENYRLYPRSDFVKALEVALLLTVYIAYGYTKGGASSFILLTLSSWFLVISWLFAPYIFSPSGFEWQKTVEDFDDWTSWLLYKGGVGVKGDNSWESWWDEEQMHIQTLRGRILETILSLRFFIFQYGIVYKLHLTGDDTSLAVYGFSWVVLIGIVMIFKIFTFSPKKSTNFQLMLRFIQGVTALGLVAALCLVVALTRLSIADLFASVLAFVATGWAIICLAITWKRVVRSLGMWDSVKEFARMYDAGMGMIIFAPIAVLSWFPFVSTFQSRILFDQAFSRGLEIWEQSQYGAFSLLDQAALEN